MAEIQWRLKNLRCQLKRETQAKEQFEQKKTEMEKEMMALEQKKAKINQKKGIVNQRILQLKMLFSDQVRYVRTVIAIKSSH